MPTVIHNSYGEKHSDGRGDSGYRKIGDYV